MIVLKILLGILIFFALILLIRATVTIEYGETLSLVVSVFGIIRIRILPAKPKKVRLGKYTPKKIKKRQEKQRKAEIAKAKKKKEKKQAKKEKKEAEKKLTPQEKAKRPTIIENINMILEILKMFFSRFSKHLRIKVARLHLVIATGDAANTAILYGAVCQAVNPIVMLLEKYLNINKLEKADIDVRPDFVGDSIQADVKISFSISVWQIADIGLRALKSFIKTKLNAAKRAARAEAMLEARKQAIKRQAANSSGGSKRPAASNSESK